MATGITEREKHGEDARQAPPADPHPLPAPDAAVRLDYPGKLEAAAVLAPREAALVRVPRAGAPAPATLAPNAFVLADNLLALHALRESGRKATLVYLDPPYGTGLDFESRALRHAYKDDLGPAAWLESVRRRLILVREVMADDGSLYLQIDHRRLFHLKAILDEVFGAERFQNLIVRRTCSNKGATRRRYPNLHDYLLFYSKGPRFVWNPPGEIPDEAWIAKEYPKRDAGGRYKLVPIHAPGTRNGETGRPWRGRPPPPGKHWQFAPETLDDLDAAGLIHWSRSGNPRRKVYLDPDKTRPLTDYWGGFRDAHHQSVAITGYPTEKNLEMLRVIVAASSREGDLVLDPYCGSGTALQAAHELGRAWIGGDASFAAAEATLARLRHGRRPMGDFVRGPGEAAPVAGPEPAFRFLADAALLEDRSGALADLARL